MGSENPATPGFESQTYQPVACCYTNYTIPAANSIHNTRQHSLSCKYEFFMYHMTEFTPICLQLTARLDGARHARAVSRVGWSNDEKTRLYENHQGTGENLHGCGKAVSFASEQPDVAGNLTDSPGVFQRARNLRPQNICFETCHENSEVHYNNRILSRWFANAYIYIYIYLFIFMCVCVCVRASTVLSIATGYMPRSQVSWIRGERKVIWLPSVSEAYFVSIDFKLQQAIQSVP